MAEEKKFSGSNRPARKQAVPERKEFARITAPSCGKIDRGDQPHKQVLVHGQVVLHAQIMVKDKHAIPLVKWYGASRPNNEQW